MTGRLEGKVAIITGASSGIGLETARLFAREGAKLVLAARRVGRLENLAEELAEAYGTEAIAVRTDVSESADCYALPEVAFDRFGCIDVLVNNAGIVDKHMPIDLCDDEWWQTILNIDLTSCYRIAKGALAHMASGSAIVNVSSIGGVFGSSGVAYSAAKAGVIGMTKNIAIRYAARGIRCNAVCPGPTPTELNTPDAMADFCGEFADECCKHMDMELPEATVVDQANAILFLSCDESAAITGRSLIVDHGMTL